MILSLSYDDCLLLSRSFNFYLSSHDDVSEFDRLLIKRFVHMYEESFPRSSSFSFRVLNLDEVVFISTCISFYSINIDDYEVQFRLFSLSSKINRLSLKSVFSPLIF